MLLKVLFFCLMFYLHIGFVCLRNSSYITIWEILLYKNAFSSSILTSRLEKLFKFNKSRKFSILVTKILFLLKSTALVG